MKIIKDLVEVKSIIVLAPKFLGMVETTDLEVKVLNMANALSLDLEECSSLDGKYAASWYVDLACLAAADEDVVLSTRVVTTSPQIKDKLHYMG